MYSFKIHIKGVMGNSESTERRDAKRYVSRNLGDKPSCCWTDQDRRVFKKSYDLRYGITAETDHDEWTVKRICSIHNK